MSKDKSIKVEMSIDECQTLCAILNWVALGSTGRPKDAFNVLEKLETTLISMGYDGDELLTLYELLEAIPECEGGGLIFKKNITTKIQVKQNKSNIKLHTTTNISTPKTKTLHAAVKKAFKINESLKEKKVKPESPISVEDAFKD